MSEFCEGLSVLPRSWQWAVIGDVAEVIGGGTPSTSDQDNFGGSIPWITPADMSKHTAKKICQGSRSLSVQGLNSSGARWLPEGTVLFSSRAPIGYVVIAQLPLTTNQGFKSFIPAKGISSDYVYYWLLSAKELAKKLASGTTFPEISGANARLIPFPVAPSSEQERIVQKLEELLSDLDAGVAELNAAQDKLTQFRQSLLKAAMCGSLTASWRANRASLPEHAQSAETGDQLLKYILKERRARWETKQIVMFQQQGKSPVTGWQDKYIEPAAADTSGLPELPPGWVWACAEQICEFITKGSTPSKTSDSMDSRAQKTIPFLRVTNLTDTGGLDLYDKVFVSERTHCDLLARSIVYPGDVLMNIVGPPLGQVSIVPSDFPEWNINQAIAIFRAVKGILPSFICHYLLSSPAQLWLKARSKTTAGQTNLTLDVCRKLPIPLPPQLEQLELVELLDEAIGRIYAQDIALKSGFRQSAAQRRNLLKAAFSGLLVPQDPTDEPASILLNKIRLGLAARDVQPRERRTRDRKIAA